MAQSEVQICNMALSRIAISIPISSLSEASAAARACSLWFEQCRDNLLQSYPWKFAHKAVALQDIGSAPSGWAYRYRYPNDCLRALKVTEEGGGRSVVPTSKHEYEVISDAAGTGKAIVCDLQPAYLHYVSRVTEPTMFDPAFTNALAWLLASEIATPLSADAKYAQAAYQNFMGAVNEAFAHSINEGYEGRDPYSDLLSGRF